MVASPVRKIRETGTEAANTVKPTITPSSLGMRAERITTSMTDMIRNARGQGWGMSRERIRVRAKTDTKMLRQPRTKRRMNQ